MDYEKKYKEALSWMQSLYKGLHGATKEDAEHYFPELKESEDEKAIRDIKVVLESSATKFFKEEGKMPVWYDRAIAWLEKQGKPEDMGEVSDGYHTFNELYYYRMLYNAAFFNRLPKDWVHKSKRHHDGEECFGGGWFIVMANLPTGQISNHYELKDWDLFQIPEKDIADEWDGHTPQEAAERLHKFLLEKQGEHANFQNKIQIGDKVTRNKDGVLVNLSQLNRVAKKDEKQGAIKDGNSIDPQFAKPIANTETKTQKFKVKYAGSEYNVLEIRNINGVRFYGIEDEPNHIDYVKAESCKIISGYAIKENGSPYPTKPAVFSEQNSADKVEPKFKVGDWIINRTNATIAQIVAVTDSFYDYREQSGQRNMSYQEYVEWDYRPWTIQDAKDGDVLACCDNKPFIFKGFFDLNFPNCLAAYCGVTLENQFGHCNGKTFWTNQDVKPATKEQCNLLFQKMHEAGYEWDAEKKELKKIKQNPTGKFESKFNAGDWIINEQGSAFLIAYINEEYQRYEFEIGGYSKEQMNYENIEFADSHYHLWSIEDAKPGDMLCTKCGTDKKKEIIFIFKGIGNRDYLDEPCVDDYCYLCEGSFYVSTTDTMGTLSDIIKRGTCPATKTQREALLTKMNNVGYAWNEEENRLIHFKVDKENEQNTEIDTRSLLFHKDDRDYEAIKLIKSAMVHCPYMESEDKKKVNDWLNFIQRKLS